jgi:hypothetical protein
MSMWVCELLEQALIAFGISERHPREANSVALIANRQEKMMNPIILSIIFRPYELLQQELIH